MCDEKTKRIAAEIPRRDKRAAPDYQRAVGELVEREVIYCASAIVAEVGRADIEQWFHLFVQEDWEEPAMQALLHMAPAEIGKLLEKYSPGEDADGTPERKAHALLQSLKADDALPDFCHERSIDPDRNEIHEHWIVSDWLASRLEDRGEVIERDFHGLTIWGRACTGQAILLDRVICAIYDELHYRDKAHEIAALNDELRRRVGMPPFFGPPGRGLAVFTRGIISLSPENQIITAASVRDFDNFTEDNDPHGEHDFGAFEIAGVDEKIFWKIDYYADASCSLGSEDPSDPARCYRVMTIMLASEY